MLEGYGIHTLIWDSADERLGDFLVASPADASGRGLDLHVRQGGAAADLTDANVYFLWRHKMAGERGCEPFEEIDASLGQFVVYYSVAMCEEEGAVDGTLEFNYVDGRHCYSGGTPVNAWEIDPSGYSSASARPYDSIKLQVTKVVIHSSWAHVGMTNASYLFNSFQNMTEVSGFEYLSGITSATQMFVSCPALKTIYATSFSNTGLSGSLMFNGCNRLVGGTDGFVPSTTSGASVCKLGSGGVLTDPNNDSRHWFYAYYYDDGEAVLTASSTPDATRTLRASGRICAEAKYVGLGFTPWDGTSGSTHRQYLTSATFAADMAGFSYLNFQYLFYSCTNLASVSGLGNLSGVRSMRFMFASCAVTALDFRGFDPSTLTDLYYCFSGCSHLATIYADSTWALPSSGISGSQCFYGCSTSLVGGNGFVVELEHGLCVHEN